MSAVAGLDTTYRFRRVDENGDTAATFIWKARGNRNVMTTRPDDTSRIQVSGNGWLVLYPTDSPSGPSATAFSGNLTFESDSDYNFTVTRWTGHRVDICAALS